MILYRHLVWMLCLAVFARSVCTISFIATDYCLEKLLISKPQQALFSLVVTNWLYSFEGVLFESWKAVVWWHFQQPSQPQVALQLAWALTFGRWLCYITLVHLCVNGFFSCSFFSSFSVLRLGKCMLCKSDESSASWSAHSNIQSHRHIT